MEALHIGYFEAAVAGLLSFASPCVLPLVVPYLAWVGGIAMPGASDADTPGRLPRGALGNAVAFVLGFVLLFIALGVTATAVGRTLAQYPEGAAAIAGAVLILLGLHVARVLPIRALAFEARIHAALRPGGPVGAFVAGVAFAFGWSPCVGPVLATILTLAGTRESLAEGAGLLAVYGAAMGAPFLLGAVFTAPFLRLVRRVQPHRRFLELATGGLVVATGLLIMTGTFWQIGYWMLQVFPFLAWLG